MMLYASIISCSKPSPYFFLPVIRLYFIFPEVFLVKSKLVVTSLVKSSLDCRHVCLLERVLLLAGCCERERILRSSPLCLLWWSLLLIVDTSVSWRVFFSWLDVVKGFFCCPPWTSRSFYVSVFFLWMNQTVDLAVPNVPAISLMDLTIVCFSCMRDPLTAWCGSQQHLESTPDLLPA